MPEILIPDDYAEGFKSTTVEVDGDNIIYGFYLLKDSEYANYEQIEIEKDNFFPDYKPKNNKLYCYPYNYLYVTNNVGNSNIYKYEDFSSTDKCRFGLDMSICVGVSGRLYPIGYKGKTGDYDEQIPLPKYPVCAWSSDSYTNWLTNQAVNIASTIGLGVASAGLSVATGGLASVFGSAVIVSNAGNVANTIGEFRKASLLPNSQNGQNTGDVNFSAMTTGFIFRKMRIKTENLKIIDDYFSRFGYKINRIIIPNITGRKNYNYVEIGENEAIGFGTVPTKYMDIINNACRKGVTIWHNHENLGNYNIDNEII